MASITYRIGSRWRKSAAWLRGVFHAHITLRWYVLLRRPIPHVALFQRRVPFIERREYSQNGEDGILHAIFAKVGTTNRSFVEFGAEDGMQCNTRFLSKHRGWHGLLLDGGFEDPALNLHTAFITAENIEELFARYGVPREFDLLSIDIDGNDYWVWKAITRWKPRVVIIEYNACIPVLPAVTVPYDPAFAWDKTDYYGASLGALYTLGKEKGYTLIGTDANGVNAFFVLDALVDGNFVRQPLEQLYHPAAFKGKPGLQHPRDPQHRPWVEV